MRHTCLISRNQFVPDSSRILRPAGKQIFIRYQSSVSLSRPLVSCRRAVSRGRARVAELSDKPLAITRRQRRRADIHGLRARSVYTTYYYARVCAASRRTGAPPLLSSFPLFRILSACAPPAKERIPRSYETTAIFRYPSFLLPFFSRHLGEGLGASSEETRSYCRVLPP